MVPVTYLWLSSPQAGTPVKESPFHLVSVSRDEEGDVGKVSAGSEVVHTHGFHIYFSTL